MDRPFVAFYWTFAELWAGFDRLSPDPDKASKQSKTIRYQRELVKHYVAEERGSLIGEYPFLVRHHHHSVLEEFPPILKKLNADAKRRKATLIFVRFNEEMQWRRMNYIDQIVEQHWPDHVRLPADSVIIDGVLFDPARHFRDWDRRTEEALRLFGEQWERNMVEAVRAIPAQRGRPKLIADYLNERNCRTGKGKPWSPDNVKKQLKKILDLS